MPAYIASSAALPITNLNPGSSVAVFSAEAVTTGERSQALALTNYPQGGATPTSLDIVFSGTPGAFTFNVSFAANDAAANYACPDGTYQITAANLDTAVGGPNAAVHFDVPFSNARFICIYVVLQPANSVTVTATFKR
jgi:hypothetical protein